MRATADRQTQIYFDPACLAHDPGPVPGMGPARLEAVRMALVKIPGLEWRTADPVEPKILELAHTPDYIASVLAPIAPDTQRAFDAETFAVSGTAAAALASAGQVVAATSAAIDGEARNAFVLASPGGHHAEAETAQGFCFFNHVAVACLWAQAARALERVAVLDFDAHHGNGTQSLFWSCKGRALVSLHEETGLSGFAEETGACDNILNINLPAGSGGGEFRAALEGKALPWLTAFGPELLLVSAGFDMHRADPLATLNLETEDYAWTGKRLADFSDEICGGRLVAVMEGGYSLGHLGACAAAFVSGLSSGI